MTVLVRVPGADTRGLVRRLHCQSTCNSHVATLWDLSVDPVWDLIIVGLAGPILSGWTGLFAFKICMAIVPYVCCLINDLDGPLDFCLYVPRVRNVSILVMRWGRHKGSIRQSIYLVSCRGGLLVTTHRHRSSRMCVVAVVVVTIVLTSQTSLVAVYRESRLPLFDGAEKRLLALRKDC